MMSKKFTGPLFLVGMPRSGTKLLRALLNEHPLIEITKFETEFFPYWVKKWPSFGELSDFNNFIAFYNNVTKSLYFFYYCKLNNNVIDPKKWFESCLDYSPAGVFEALVRHNTNVPFGSDKIWGDKSPSYIRHLPLLKRNFPKAKIIHIIRDVRDYCLSINKAWGKNMIRAAQRWVDDITKARNDAKEFLEDYLEVRYEDLLDSPEQELRRICNFIGIEFCKDMLKLSEAPESIGDAKGEKTIVNFNKEKYKYFMNRKTRRTIESIAKDLLQIYGYPVNNDIQPYRVPKIKMFFYKLTDGFNLIKTEISKRGFIDAIKLTIAALRH